MKKKYTAAACFLIVLILSSCAGQSPPNYFPVPDSGIIKNTEVFVIGNIIETKNGDAGLMPVWLRSFLDEGIEAVEKLDAYSDKYVFVAINEGENITAQNKWTEYYTITHDFSLLAAARIEQRMYLTASLYPDDEFGPFYEAMMLNAYNTIYYGAEKEDTYWVRTGSENETANGSSGNYVFFILITIEKRSMQSIIRNMIAKTDAAVTMAGINMNPNQNTSVTRLRNTFFEGF
jgi:hypothetical protein